MTIKRVRDVDDLEVIPCTTCLNGRIGRGPGAVTCSNCNGSGDRVVHKVKYFEIRINSRRDRRMETR